MLKAQIVAKGTRKRTYIWNRMLLRAFLITISAPLVVGMAEAGALLAYRLA